MQRNVLKHTGYYQNCGLCVQNRFVEKAELQNALASLMLVAQY